MQILGLMGSSRRDGNTNDLLDAALRGASEAGAQVEKVLLPDYKLHHIYNCKDCKQRGACEEDDFPILRDKISAADGLIWASPLYWFTVSGLTKVLLDRLCCIMYLDTYEAFIEKMKGRLAATLCVMEETDFNKARHLLGTMEMVYEYCQWSNLGYVVGLGGSRGTILKHTDTLRQAYELGEKMAKINQTRRKP